MRFGGSTRTIVAASLLGAAAIALIALLALPPTAARTRQHVSIQNQALVIEGSSAREHVRLSMSRNGKRIVVRGQLHRGHKPRRCRRRHHRKVLRCRAGGLNAVLVDMGGSGDKLEVLDTLPVPLTVNLGRGRDKFIGAGEADLCYTGGTNRNRCIGGGGNDACIGAALNEDCVGGRGNDYCNVKAGSDGCFGGPGQDVCIMGAGHDGCHGDRGKDHLYGGSSSDQLYGGGGSDFCDGQRGVGRSHGCEGGPRH
jgi:hypothetical protein